MQTILIEIGRIGIGLIFVFSILIDIKTRPQVFALMAKKNVPLPWLFYIGAIIWIAVTSISLILNFHPFAAALLLSLYIFIANVIFNNFWTLPKGQRDFNLYLFIIHLAVCFGLLVIAGTA